MKKMCLFAELLLQYFIIDIFRYYFKTVSMYE